MFIHLGSSFDYFFMSLIVLSYSTLHNFKYFELFHFNYLNYSKLIHFSLC
jgi:hypothetical protein